MNYSRVYINSVAYELAPHLVSSSDLEARLAPVYKKLHIPQGQFAALTGIAQRRWWPEQHKLSDGAVLAAQKAIAETGIEPSALGALLYTGVCREQHEPATACQVAAKLGLSQDAVIYDVSNACLGVLTGMLDIANRIELGQIKAGMVVSCESSREIVNTVIEQLLDRPSMQQFALSLATLTGGSGAVALILTDGSLNLANSRQHKLLGATQLSASEHHDLCQWGIQSVGDNLYREVMRTDAVGLLREGVVLAKETWRQFLRARDWQLAEVDKVVCHQMGLANHKHVLSTLEIPNNKEYPTYQTLGNMGTVSLPISAAMAHDEGFLTPGDKVGFLGIGSGLNCMMLGIIW